MPVLLASLVPARPSPPAHCVRTSRTPSRHLPLRRMVTGRTRRNGGDAAAPPARSLPFSATEAGPAPPSFPDDRPVLFVHTLCPYAERAWLAFLEKVSSIVLESLPVPQPCRSHLTATAPLPAGRPFSFSPHRPRRQAILVPLHQLSWTGTRSVLRRRGPC